MAIGPGKYDKLAEMCIATTNAKAVVVIVFEGNRGNGMSMKLDLTAEFEIAGQLAIIKRLPGVLRNVADSIDRDAGHKT